MSEIIRVRASSIRTPTNDNDKGNSSDQLPLRVKHIISNPNQKTIFCEDAPLYDLVITDYDEKDFRILRYTKRDGLSVVFLRQQIGLIRRSSVELMYITNI